MKQNRIIKELIRWYNQNKRDLPWRKNRDPYEIWLAEVILQQTRVDQGLPYFFHFKEKYPTVNHLAEAPIDDVLRCWQGLGYYSRARNLHKCAKTIVDKYNGKFPSEREDLIRLPGIGPYTSAAIASFAFGKKEAVVDGNVIRVVTRLYGIEDDISEKKTLNQIKIIVDDLIPKSIPGLFNQAIMEFGALHCTPKKPSCNICGFLGICEAQIKGKQDKLPFKSRKTKKRLRYFNYFLIKINDKYLLRKREERDIWNGLFEFFLIETKTDMSFDQLQLPDKMILYPQEWKILEESKTYKHLLSHQTIMCRFYKIHMSKEFEFDSKEWEEYKLYSKEEIDSLPKSILIDRYFGE
ncbi:MAG: A/G-specific adenine glycosylase [Cyclobacteriaceae bacterium]|nr:A/G-specific adenine glycosylase [Cyclobacteriaceae bacterium]